MTYLITRERFKTELGKQVYDKITTISTDTNFILSILYDVIGDERKKDFLEWLESNKTATTNDVLDYLETKYYSDI